MYAYDSGAVGIIGTGNSGQSGSGGSNGGGSWYGYSLTSSGNAPYREGRKVKVKISASGSSSYCCYPIYINGVAVSSTKSSNAGVSVSGSTTVEWDNPGPFTAKTVTVSMKHYDEYGGSHLASTAHADYTTGTLSTPMSVDLTLNANGGTVSPSTGYVYYGRTYGTLPTPTRSGYIFDGWYTNTNTKITSSSTVTTTNTTQTLYAHWKKTITFNANGGSVSPTSRVIDDGSAYGTLPTPTRTGYIFLGWFTAQSGGTEVYASTVPSGGSHDIYAHWKPMTIFRRVQNGSMTMYPLVYIKENGETKKAVGLYVVENGVAKQCI